MGEILHIPSSKVLPQVINLYILCHAYGTMERQLHSTLRGAYCWPGSSTPATLRYSGMVGLSTPNGKPQHDTVQLPFGADAYWLLCHEILCQEDPEIKTAKKSRWLQQRRRRALISHLLPAAHLQGNACASCRCRCCCGVPRGCSTHAMPNARETCVHHSAV